MTLAEDQKTARTPVMEGKITDEQIERLRARIGVPVPHRVDTYNPVADQTSIAHFAFGMGDLNSLYRDPEYATRTRWRGQIAPPTFLCSAGVNETPEPEDDAIRRSLRGVFRGVGKYFQSVTWEWFRPVYANDAIFEREYLLDVAERTSKFAGGKRSVAETTRWLYVDRAGFPLGTRDETYLNVERGASRSASKSKKPIERATYSPEEIDEITRAYVEEKVRGAVPRYWEDTQIGDRIDRIVKGPLTVTDIISNHMARGWGGYGPGPLRHAALHRQRIPNFYVPDRFGVPDNVQRLHWDQERAEAVGLHAPYDYGQMRAAWLTQAVTNWMGDDAWLWQLESQVRGFNFIGDTQWITGEVTAVREVDIHRVVDIDLRCINQRGEITAPAHATVILPSREHGPVAVPSPPASLREIGAAIVSRRPSSTAPHAPDE